MVPRPLPPGLKICVRKNPFLLCSWPFCDRRSTKQNTIGHISCSRPFQHLVNLGLTDMSAYWQVCCREPRHLGERRHKRDVNISFYICMYIYKRIYIYIYIYIYIWHVRYLPDILRIWTFFQRKTRRLLMTSEDFSHRSFEELLVEEEWPTFRRCLLQ